MLRVRLPFGAHCVLPQAIVSVSALSDLRTLPDTLGYCCEWLSNHFFFFVFSDLSVSGVQPSQAIFPSGFRHHPQ